MTLDNNIFGMRLRQGREARGLTSEELAELVGVSKAAISKYENGKHIPRWEVRNLLMEQLNLPGNYFVKPYTARAIDSCQMLCRPARNLGKSFRLIVTRRFEWFNEIFSYFSQYVSLPERNIPTMDVPCNLRDIDEMMVEDAARQLRSFWGLGFGPVEKIIQTMEANGIRVAYTPLGTHTSESVSDLSGSYPNVFINSDNTCALRSRFNCAYAIGHIILHAHIDARAVTRLDDFHLFERQASHFAAAFLFPVEGFEQQDWQLNPDVFRSLSSTWKLPFFALISRARQLGMIDDRHAKHLLTHQRPRHQEKHEPSNSWEKPRVLSEAAKTLIDSGVKSEGQIISDLALAPQDLVDLVGEDAWILGRFRRERDSHSSFK